MIRSIKMFYDWSNEIFIYLFIWNLYCARFHACKLKWSIKRLSRNTITEKRTMQHEWIMHLNLHSINKTITIKLIAVNVTHVFHSMHWNIIYTNKNIQFAHAESLLSVYITMHEKCYEKIYLSKHKQIFLKDN